MESGFLQGTAGGWLCLRELFVSRPAGFLKRLAGCRANQRGVKPGKPLPPLRCPLLRPRRARPARALKPVSGKITAMAACWAPRWKAEASQPPANCRYIGVFTCKGGVGKPPPAAHLAGAFALMGHDVILLDATPDQNLLKLFRADTDDADSEASLFAPALMKSSPAPPSPMLSHAQWQQVPTGDYRDAKVVICDCLARAGGKPGRAGFASLTTASSHHAQPMGIAKTPM